MDKKYEIIMTDSKKVNDDTVYRIRALRDIRGRCKAGDLGGYVSGEHNLSHEGRCWITDEAIVKDNAIVRNNAMIKEKSLVDKSALVINDALIKGNALITEHAIVSGEAQVGDAAEVSEFAVVTDFAIVEDRAFIAGRAHVIDYAYIFEDAQVSGTTTIYDRASIRGQAYVSNVNVGGRSIISCSFNRGNVDSKFALYVKDAFLEYDRDFKIMNLKPIDIPIVVYKDLQGEFQVGCFQVIQSVRDFIEWVKRGYNIDPMTNEYWGAFRLYIKDCSTEDRIHA